MANKIASLMLSLIAVSAFNTIFSQSVLAADQLPPGLAELPQASPPTQTASPSAPSQEAASTMPAGALSPSSASQNSQQWASSGNNELQQGPMMPSTTTNKSDLRAPLTYEQSKQVMLETAPEAPQPVSSDADTAFDSLMQQNMPLSPQQVIKLRQQIDTAQRAAAIPPTIPPKPVSTTLMVNLAPGTSPPAIRLAQGYVSALVFVDSTGAPWPISQFDVGNPKAVNLQWDGKSNIILIQAVAPYSNGDIVVRLAGLPTPITLEIVSGQRVVDYRVDIHVSGIGPNTKELPIGTSLPGSANQLLLGVLDGVAPAGSKLLTVRGADAQAWLLGQTMYVRTRLTVLSPGWVGKMVSPDGMQAYELPRTSSVLVSRYGEPVELKIEGL